MMKLHLKIRDTSEILSGYVFVNKPFEIPYSLVDETDNLFSHIKEPIHVDVKAYFDDDPLQECPRELLDVYSVETSSIQRNGGGSVTVFIKDVSMNHDNRKIVIKFTPAPTSQYDILPAQTSPVVSVRHKLMVIESNTSSYTW